MATLSWATTARVPAGNRPSEGSRTARRRGAPRSDIEALLESAAREAGCAHGGCGRARGR